MAFPTTPILDNFNRPDATLYPTDGIWGGQLRSDTAASQRIASNQCTFSSGGVNSNYWPGLASLGAPATCEVYVTIVSLGNNVEICARVRDPGTAGWTGYLLDYANATGTWVLFTHDAGGFHAIGAGIVTPLGVGDQMGMALDGSTITIYKNGTSIGTRTDSTYIQTGYLGLCGVSASFDNFGGSPGSVYDFHHYYAFA